MCSENSQARTVGNNDKRCHPRCADTCGSTFDWQLGVRLALLLQQRRKSQHVGSIRVECHDSPLARSSNAGQAVGPYGPTAQANVWMVDSCRIAAAPSRFAARIESAQKGWARGLACLIAETQRSGNRKKTRMCEDAPRKLVAATGSWRCGQRCTERGRVWLPWFCCAGAAACCLRGLMTSPIARSGVKKSDAGNQAVSGRLLAEPAHPSQQWVPFAAQDHCAASSQAVINWRCIYDSTYGLCESLAMQRGLWCAMVSPRECVGLLTRGAELDDASRASGLGFKAQHPGRPDLWLAPAAWLHTCIPIELC